MRNSFHRYFAHLFIDVLLFFHGLGDILGSCAAILEVILVILDAGLNNCFEFGRKFARHIPNKRIGQLARLPNRWKKWIWRNHFCKKKNEEIINTKGFGRHVDLMVDIVTVVPHGPPCLGSIVGARKKYQQSEDSKDKHIGSDFAERGESKAPSQNHLRCW